MERFEPVFFTADVFPEKALEWHKQIWAGKLDPAQVSMSDYCGHFLSWGKSSRNRWELARGLM
jgi:hypothetical protein